MRGKTDSGDGFRRTGGCLPEVFQLQTEHFRAHGRVGDDSKSGIGQHAKSHHGIPRFHAKEMMSRTGWLSCVHLHQEEVESDRKSVV